MLNYAEWISNFFLAAYDNITSPFLRNRRLFENFTSFTKYVEATMDMEWGARIAQVTWAKSKTEMYVDAIRKSHVYISDAGMEQVSYH